MLPLSSVLKTIVQNATDFSHIGCVIVLIFKVCVTVRVFITNNALSQILLKIHIKVTPINSFPWFSWGLEGVNRGCAYWFHVTSCSAHFLWTALVLSSLNQVKDAVVDSFCLYDSWTYCSACFFSAPHRPSLSHSFTQTFLP